MFGFGSGSVRTPTRTSLFQVKLSAGVRWRSTSRGPSAPQCHSSTAGITTDCEGAATPGVLSSNNMGSTWGQPSQGSACLPWCWQSNQWQHRPVEPSLLHGLMQARAHPREVQLGQHNHNWASRTATQKSQPWCSQWIVSLKALISKSARSCSKQLFLCLLAALSNAHPVPCSCAQLYTWAQQSHHWLARSSCRDPEWGTGKEELLLPPDQDWKADSIPVLGSHAAAAHKNQSNEEKKHVWAGISDHHVLLSPVFLLVGQWSLAKSVLETCQGDRKEGTETEASEHRSHQKSEFSRVSYHSLNITPVRLRWETSSAQAPSPPPDNSLCAEEQANTDTHAKISFFSERALCEVFCQAHTTQCMRTRGALWRLLEFFSQVLHAEPRFSAQIPKLTDNSVFHILNCKHTT